MLDVELRRKHGCILSKIEAITFIEPIPDLAFTLVGTYPLRFVGGGLFWWPLNTFDRPTKCEIELASRSDLFPSYSDCLLSLVHGFYTFRIIFDPMQN